MSKTDVKHTADAAAKSAQEQIDGLKSQLEQLLKDRINRPSLMLPTAPIRRLPMRARSPMFSCTMLKHVSGRVPLLLF
ncbi:hypothetical protein [Asaia platycodi]|uniref:hypothetical protein n=1 Tax=Asaia platycodi TaxID=610243 RepID=UPI0004709BE0|nr:hypothetical protein [Asaia platycodi]